MATSGPRSAARTGRRPRAVPVRSRRRRDPRARRSRRAPLAGHLDRGRVDRAGHVSRGLRDRRSRGAGPAPPAAPRRIKGGPAAGHDQEPVGRRSRSSSHAGAERLPRFPWNPLRLRASRACCAAASRRVSCYTSCRTNSRMTSRRCSSIRTTTSSCTTSSSCTRRPSCTTSCSPHRSPHRSSSRCPTSSAPNH